PTIPQHSFGASSRAWATISSIRSRVILIAAPSLPTGSFGPVDERPRNRLDVLAGIPKPAQHRPVLGLAGHDLSAQALMGREAQVLERGVVSSLGGGLEVDQQLQGVILAVQVGQASRD